MRTVVAIATAFLAAVAVAGATALAAPASTKTYSVVISPEYTTVRDPTTLGIVLANMSSTKASLDKAHLEAPFGFKLANAALPSGSPGQATASGRSLDISGISIAPRSSLIVTVTAVSVRRCARVPLHWTSTASGSAGALTLQTAASSLTTTVACQLMVRCPQDKVCRGALRTRQALFAVVSNPVPGTKNAGVLSMTLNFGRRLSCAGYRSRDTNWYEFSVTSGERDKVVTYRIRNARPLGVRACLGGHFQFKSTSGAQAPTADLPDGSRGNLATLPACPKKPATPTVPCVASVGHVPDRFVKTKTDTVLKIVLPAGLQGDPWIGG